MNKGDKLKSVSFKIDETKTIKSSDLKEIFQLFIFIQKTILQGAQKKL